MSSAANTIRCKRCSYPLRNIRDSRCPECGHQFDFADPRTYTTNSHLGWRRFLPLTVGVALGATLGALNFTSLVPSSSTPEWLELPWFLAHAPWIAAVLFFGLDDDFPLYRFIGPVLCYSLYGALFTLRPRRYSTIIVLLAIALIISAIHAATFAYLEHFLRTME